MKYDTPDTAEKVAAEVRALNPDALAVRVLPDGSVAMLHDLLFTRAIHLGCTAWGWSSRFCFEDPDRASALFAELQTEDDEPVGCVARRGRITRGDT